MWKGINAPFNALTDIHLAQIDFKESGKAGFFISKEQNILLYVIKGDIHVNNKDVPARHLAVFAHDDETVEITALTDSVILFGYATPLREPFVAQGPFVMNTSEEIMKAYEDYNNGKFGDEKSFG